MTPGSAGNGDSLARALGKHWRLKATVGVTQGERPSYELRGSQITDEIMQMPNISNVAKDEGNNITINVLAYRKLSEAELIRSIRYFRSTKQGRRLKKNTNYTIVSIIGVNDPI